jgi:pyruvate/2-oxoglutarate dehydrogenase complex dihydrolipoamide acyltransferase (E2) component
MRHVVKVPKISDSADEVVVTGWYANPRQAQVEGDPLIRVETNEAEVDIPPHCGVSSRSS